MIKVALPVNDASGFCWFSNENVFVKGYLFTQDGTLYDKAALSGYFSRITGRDDFLSRLKGVTGLFSVVVLQGEELFAATDVVRTFPLFYRMNGDTFHISDTPSLLLGEEEPLSLNSRSVLQFESIGYVLGRDTLLNELYQLQAQEVLFFDGKEIKRLFYERERRTTSVCNRMQLKSDFRQMLSLLSDRLVKLLDGRPVLLPLSGGYDSRLLAWMLKETGYENVLCFTYGFSDTSEKENAQKSAEALGFRWLFIDYSEYLGQDVTASEKFREWIRFTSNYSSFFYFQEYLAAYHLKMKGLAAENAVFIPGHSADGVAGNFLISGMEEMSELESFVRYASMKNANLRSLNRHEREMLNEDITATMLCYKGRDKVDYTLYEKWQTRERQAKQIVNSSKIWDFFGHQYALPFWDELFTSFFDSLPYSYKINKNFYIEAVNELFSEKGISFDSVLRPVRFAEKKQRLKFWLTKFSFLHPFLLRRNLWGCDIAHFREFFGAICLDLERAERYKKILQQNGILSAWYLLYIEGKVT